MTYQYTNYDRLHRMSEVCFSMLMVRMRVRSRKWAVQ